MIHFSGCQLLWPLTQSIKIVYITFCPFNQSTQIECEMVNLQLHYIEWWKKDGDRKPKLIHENPGCD